MQQQVRRVWHVRDDIWVIEFPDERSAQEAREEYQRLREAEGEEEAEAWVEDIIGRHGGRIV